MTKQERILQLSRASDWAAALAILTSDRFVNDGRVWQHVDLERQCIYFSKMVRDGTFSSGEIALLRMAASLFSTDERVNLWRTLGALDEEACRLALRAMGTYCRVEVNHA
jgi:hypothetical protein